MSSSLSGGLSFRLGLSFNQIKSVENGSLALIPKIREICLDNNKLKKVPAELGSLRNLQVRSLLKIPPCALCSCQ